MQGDELGIVVIGRNEGERLRNCLQSIRDVGPRIYVDSGSTDGSQEFARSLGFTVLDLDRDEEFTAARARNLGLFHIARHNPDVRFVQTVDGDCEVVAGWAAQARCTMEDRPDLAVVFGRRRERFPERNIYHQACEIEWNVPSGPADSCGGDALFRLASVMSVGGFNPHLISGEEPDLCYRLRQQNLHILSNGRDMTLHDVDITNFRQWWRRALRAGHGITELAFIHGLNANPGWRRFLLSGSLWGGFLLLTIVAIVAAIVTAEAGLAVVAIALVAILGLQILRTSARARSQFSSHGTAIRWATLLLVSKLAQLQGALLYFGRRLTSSRKAIIEYK